LRACLWYARQAGYEGNDVMSLVWREQLSVGNDVIDSDHKYLIQLINQVERSMAIKSQEEMTIALNGLSEYSKKHFVLEEKIAHAVGHTKTAQLNKSHELLVKRLEQVKQEIAEMGEEWSLAAVEKFTGLLRDWLIDHVIKEDMLMKPTMLKHPPSFNPM